MQPFVLEDISSILQHGGLTTDEIEQFYLQDISSILEQDMILRANAHLLEISSRKQPQQLSDASPFTTQDLQVYGN